MINANLSAKFERKIFDQTRGIFEESLKQIRVVMNVLVSVKLKHAERWRTLLQGKQKEQLRLCNSNEENIPQWWICSFSV